MRFDIPWCVEWQTLIGYVGPAGVGGVGILILVGIVLLIGVIGLVLYPLRLWLRSRRVARQEPERDSQTGETAPGDQPPS